MLMVKHQIHPNVNAKNVYKLLFYSYVYLLEAIVQQDESFEIQHNV